MEKQITSQSPIATRPASNALTEIENSRAVAEVQGAIILAKRFPRDQVACQDRIMTACQRPGLAEAALYSYARGGSDVTGPSIRLAEAAAQNWGNLQYGVRELDQRNGESTMEAYAWDMETNVRQVKTFQVKHKRFTKSGSYDLVDPRDIYEATANQGARRLRACILGIIPGDIIDAAVTQCEETLKSKADTSPEALKKLVEAFATYKVTKEQIEKRIQRRLDSIAPAQLVQLRKVYNSLKDNMSTAADWFEVAPPEEGKQEKTPGKLKDRIKAKKEATTAAPLPSTEAVHTVAQAGLDIIKPAAETPTDPNLETAKLECPNNPGTTYMKAFCKTCTTFEGCPAWA